MPITSKQIIFGWIEKSGINRHTHTWFVYDGYEGTKSILIVLRRRNYNYAHNVEVMFILVWIIRGMSKSEWEL